MVAVLHAAPQTAAPQAVAAWLDTLAGDYPADERASFAAAFEYARERCGDAARPDGEPLLDRALGTATILAGLKLDAGSIRAALLLGLPGAGAFDADDVAARFGADVATLVAGVARMGEIRARRRTGDAEERAAQAESLRKMLLAMVEDIRVVLIKLAERTQALRYADDRRRGSCATRGRARGARPLRAARQPARRLAAEVGARGPVPARARARRPTRRSRRCSTSAGSTASATSRTCIATLQRELAARRHHGRGHGRPKHIYSIWNKMRRKQVGHRRALRHPRGAHPRRRRQGLLHGARRRAPPVDADAAASSTTTSRSRRPTTTGRCTPR